jgi:hypothetical protein
MLSEMNRIQRQKVEISGNVALVEQVRKLILDSEFQKYEEDFPDRSAFKDLLMIKKTSFDSCPMSKETRTKLVSLFKAGYQKTGLAKISQLIEMLDILLENRISFIVVCYHQIVVNALSASFEKRKVPFIDISNFFARCNGEQENQSAIIQELSQFSSVYTDDGRRNHDHLIVGLLNYSTFT